MEDLTIVLIGQKTSWTVFVYKKVPENFKKLTKNHGFVKLGLNVSPVLAKNSCKIVKKIEKR